MASPPARPNAADWSSNAESKSFATFFDPSTCVRKGLCPVTKIRHQEHDALPPQSHSLYYEQHGSGPEKVLFIMGCVASVQLLRFWGRESA
jgi:hypothetical protein